MRRAISIGCVFWLLAIASARATEHPHVLLICVDDLRPELHCYGAEYIQSPNIDALAARGRLFAKHYVQAPTCGASRYALLTGCYGPYGNGALLQRGRRLIEDRQALPPSLPAWFRDHGYQTVSLGKVSHHPGGRGGANWDDPNRLEMPFAWDRHSMPVGDWQHPRGAMHGLAHGEIRRNAKQMAVFESAPGEDSIYPDGLTADAAEEELERLAAQAPEKPFFLAVGFIRPHLPFGAPAKYFAPYEDVELPPIPHPKKPAWRSTWHGSGEFMKYQRWGRNPNSDAEFGSDVRKHYAACVTYADALVGRLLKKLDALELTDDTIIVLWGDHGWHLGEHAIWGKHALFEESLHAPLIIAAPELSQPGVSTRAVVETIDLFPTLCELAALPCPDGLHGESLIGPLEDPERVDGRAFSYIGRATTIRSPRFRLIQHADGYRELYDQEADEPFRNLAEEKREVAEQLARELEELAGLRATAAGR